MAEIGRLSPRAQGLVAINIAAVIFGSAALYGKLDVSPFWIVALRAGFAALALALVAGLRRESLPLAKVFWPAVIGTGLILAVHWLAFFASVQQAGVAIATLTFAAFPIFTVLLEALTMRRQPPLPGLLAGAMILAAVLLLASGSMHGGQLAGTLIGLVSALAFAVFGLASKRLGCALSPLKISLYQNLVVAVALLPCLPFAQPIPASATQWGLLVLLGVVTTALMHQLYFYALRRLSASTCSGFVSLEPVYAIAFAALFFNEPLTLWVTISGGLILLASLILLRAEGGVKPGG